MSTINTICRLEKTDSSKFNKDDKNFWLHLYRFKRNEKTIIKMLDNLSNKIEKLIIK